MDVSIGKNIRIDTDKFSAEFLQHAHNDIDNSAHEASKYMRENGIHELNEALMALLKTPRFTDSDPMIVATALSMLSEQYTHATHQTILRAQYAGK